MFRRIKHLQATLLLAGGFGLIAASSAALLAVAPRIVSHGSFSGISVGLLISVVFGFGVSTPTEQLISRQHNAGEAARGRSPAAWLGLWAGLTIVAVLLTVLATSARHTYPLMAWSILAVVGWYLVSPRRGELLGQQRVSAYAVTMIGEGVTRLLLVVIAVAWRDAAVVVLGLSIGLPIVVSAGAAQLVRIRSQGVRGRDPAPAFEHLSFVVIALGYQAALNLPPVALSWKIPSHDREFVGAFVIANSWMRLPTILVGTITVSALVGLSRAAGRGSALDFRHGLVRSGAACLTVAGVGAVLCAATIGPATTLLYGSDVRLPAHGTFYLALSTALAITCSWLSVPLMALRHSQHAAWIWSAGSALVLVTLVALPARQLITWGLVAPLAVTTVALTVSLVRRRGSWAAPNPVAA
jgi:O-antigen/teichoic acid export membrane protein